MILLVLIKLMKTFDLYLVHNNSKLYFYVMQYLLYTFNKLRDKNSHSNTLIKLACTELCISPPIPSRDHASHRSSNISRCPGETFTEQRLANY